MLTRIPGNLLEDSGNVLILAFHQGMFEKIARNVPDDSREFYQRFPEIFKKILGNFSKHSEECSRRFQGMLSISN